MEQTDSIRGELQTLIALEQQQVETLGAIHSRGAFNPTPMQVGGFGFNQSHYAPGMSGFQNIPAVGSYVNQVSGALNYGQNVMANTAVGSAMNNFNSRVRNAMVGSNVDSMNFFTANQSKMSAEARELLGANMGAKMSAGAFGAASILSGTAGSYLGSAAGSALFGGSMGALAGSLLFGAAGGAVVGGTVDIMADQVKQNYEYDRYLLQNSHKFINLFESNNDRNVGGFNRKERWDMSNWLRHFNTEKSITDEDTMTILKGFTEGDLLRDVSDVDKFKEKMSQLTDSLKSMAISLNETYEEVAQMMADLKKKGIDQRDYKNLAATGKVLGTLTGQDGSEVVDFTTDLTQALVQGTRLDPDRVLRTVTGTEAYMAHLYENGGEEMFNMITNRGGIEGSTSDYMQIAKNMLSENDTKFSQMGAAFFDWNGSEWVFNEGTYNQFKQQNWSLDQLAQMSVSKMNAAGLGGIQNWQDHQGYYTMNTFGKSAFSLSEFTKEMLQSAEKTAGLNGMGTDFQLQALFGMKGEDSTFFSKITDAIYQDNGKLESQLSAASIAQTMISDYYSVNPGFGYTAKNWWGGVKDELGDIGDTIASPFRKMGRAISDWWTGKPVEEVQALWMETDWSKNPFDDFQNSLLKYQETVFKAGDTDKAKEIASEFFGGTYTYNQESRQVYNSMKELTAAIKELTGDSEDLAKAIQEASRQGGVSESTSVALMKTLGVSDPQKATEIINKVAAEIQGGKTEEEAAKTVAAEYGLTDAESQTKVIQEKEAQEKSGSMYGTFSMTPIDKVNRDTMDTAQRMIARDESVAVSALDIEIGGNYNGAGDEALYFNEMFGFHYTNKKSGDFTDAMDWTNKDSAEGEDYLFDGERGAGFSDAELNDMDYKIADPLRQAGDALREFQNAENKEDTQWAKMSQEERYNALMMLQQGQKYYDKRGLSEEEFVKDIFDGTQDVLGMISGKKKQQKDLVEEYLFVGEDEDKIYDRVRREYGSYLDLSVTAGEVEQGEDLHHMTMGDIQKYMEDAREGRIESMSGFADLGGKTVAEASEWVKNELANLDEKYKGERNAFQAAQNDLKSFMRSKEGKEYADVMEGIESGQITAENYASNERISGNDTLKGYVQKYFDAKPAYDEYVEKRQAATAVQTALNDNNTKLVAYQTGFKSLGRVLGMNEKELAAIEGELSTTFANGNSKTTDQITASVEKVRAITANRLFGDYAGQTISEANSAEITQHLASKLMATGDMNSVDAENVAKSFVTGHTGQSLTSETMGDFVNDVMGSLTFGENAAENKLKSALENNTEALEANTAALTKKEVEKTDLAGADDSVKQSLGVDSSGNVITETTIQTNVNGSTPSSGGSSGGKGKAKTIGI